MNFTDANAGDTHTALIKWGDGTESIGTIVDPTADQPGKVLGDHVYADNGAYSVSVELKDQTNLADTVQHEIVVSNVAPTSAVTLSSSSIQKDGSVTLNGIITDPGLLDTHTVRVDWGDGHSSDAVVSVSASGVRSFAATYQYTGASAATYTITATTTDKDGGVGATSTELEIIAVNQPPVVSAPDALSVMEHTDLLISGISVSDVDAGDGIVSVTLAAHHGLVTVANAGLASLTGNGTAPLCSREL